MGKNVKLEIIQEAKKLFNEHSHNEVSTQDIADAIGISKGNLNYHFKRKEDIIEAVAENALYFWHYTQLSQIPEKIRRIQNTAIQNNYDLFSETVKLLSENGSL